MTSARARLVVFDLDGTLVDSSRDLAAAVNRALRRVAPAVSPIPEDVVRTFIGSGARVLITRSLAHASLPQSVDEVLPVFLAEYAGGLLDTTRLYPGALEALECLGDRRLAVLTNKPGDMSRAILEGLGVAARFFRVYGAGDVEARKPDPGGLRQIAREAGVDTASAVMVGDSAIDVQTGRNAGTLTVGVTYGFDTASFREHPPDFLVRSLTDLATRLS